MTSHLCPKPTSTRPRRARRTPPRPRPMPVRASTGGRQRPRRRRRRSTAATAARAKTGPCGRDHDTPEVSSIAGRAGSSWKIRPVRRLGPGATSSRACAKSATSPAWAVARISSATSSAGPADASAGPAGRLARTVAAALPEVVDDHLGSQMPQFTGLGAAQSTSGAGHDPPSPGCGRCRPGPAPATNRRSSGRGRPATGKSPPAQPRRRAAPAADRVLSPVLVNGAASRLSAEAQNGVNSSKDGSNEGSGKRIALQRVTGLARGSAAGKASGITVHPRFRS